MYSVEPLEACMDTGFNLCINSAFWQVNIQLLAYFQLNDSQNEATISCWCLGCSLCTGKIYQIEKLADLNISILIFNHWFLFFFSYI